MTTTSQQPAMPAKACDSRLPSASGVGCMDLLPGQFVNIINGDCRTALKELASESIQCVVTSPPYWGLRDYGHADQIGQEETPDAYVQTMRQVFAEVWRVLKDDGTLWLNLGDSYNGYMANQRGTGLETERQQSRKYVEPGFGLRDKTLKNKDLAGIPWRVALALREDGWYLRQDIIWHKPNPMPESVTDRCTKSHEYIFLLTKSPRYYYDQTAIKEPAKDSSVARLGQDVESQEGSDRVPGKTNGKMKAVKFGGNKQCPDTRLQSGKEWTPKGRGGKNAFRGQGHFRDGQGPANREGRDMKDVGASIMANKKSVWTVPTTGFDGAHFATFPPDLIKPCILAGTKPGDVVLDPFGGSGTTGMVALELGRRAVLVELNPEYTKLCDERCTTTRGLPLAG